MDTYTAKELYYKYGHKGSPFEERKALFRFLYILKHNPGFDNAKWQTHADECDCIVWEEFWVCLEYFLQHANELDFEERFSVVNHFEERFLDQAQARASYTPLFGGHSRSIPQGMILDVQPLVKSLFYPIRQSPNGFFLL